MTKIWLLAFAAFVAGCRSWTPPVDHHIVNDLVFDAGYDETWTAVVAMFAENNWSIKTMAKDSGLIAADVMGARGGFADCGAVSGKIFYGGNTVSGDFNLFMTKSGERQTRVRVNASFRYSVVGPSGLRLVRECFSTGKLEAMIHDTVAARLKTGP